MTKKTSQKTSSVDQQEGSLETSFDCRGLNQSVVEKLNKNADREAQMIANFNAKVNLIENIQADEHDVSVKNTETDRPAGLEPTRYGDWEKKGRCYDF